MNFFNFFNENEAYTFPTHSIDFYHATKKENVDSIINNGFTISLNGKHKYGKGVYGTLDLPSQESDLMSKNYGDVIMYGIIPPGDFITFGKNTHPEKQFIEKIGDDDKYKDIISVLSGKMPPVMKAQVFSAYQQQFPEIWEKLDGVMVNDNGTHIIVSYKPHNINIKDIIYK
jgi:hypothetical protein